MANLALPVKCEQCFGELQAETRVYQFETTIFVTPCPKCEDIMSKEVYDEGHLKGFHDGVEDGYKQCENTYKDDIRAAIKLTQDVCQEGNDEPRV